MNPTLSHAVIQGDCTEILQTLPAASAGLVITDPPYLVGYRDRSGRSVRNDDRDNASNVLGAFRHVYAAMKPDSVCISFYGWGMVDRFFAAWHDAGFKAVGHIVWAKEYASRRALLDYHHEQAYVLAKGRPARPSRPLSDVQPWEYSGNRFHPTEKAVGILKPLIEAFSQEGELVLDPFAGSGSTLVAAAFTGRSALGIELDGTYCAHARQRLAGATRFRASAGP